MITVAPKSIDFDSLLKAIDGAETSYVFVVVDHWLEIESGSSMHLNINLTLDQIAELQHTHPHVLERMVGNCLIVPFRVSRSIKWLDIEKYMLKNENNVLPFKDFEELRISTGSLARREFFSLPVVEARISYIS